jgi:hypothetical protein
MYLYIHRMLVLNVAFFQNEDIFTTKKSERLVRSPVFYNITESKMSKIILHTIFFQMFGKLLNYNNKYA